MWNVCLASALLLAGPQDDSKKAVEEFKARFRDAKTLQDKALAIRALGDADPRDAASAAAIARYLLPGGNDPCALLPATAADALAKFRGNGTASRALVATLPAVRKNPYLERKLLAAIGRVGHESALGLFEEALHGNDPDAALAAVQSIANFPAALAFEVLLREHDLMEKKKANAGDDYKKVVDKAQPEMLRTLQRLAGEKYPTMKEFGVWFQRRGAAMKDETAKRERESAPVSTGPLPPVLLVELLFKEGSGGSTQNSGATAGVCPSASLAGAKWTTSAALSGGPAAMEWERTGGLQAVELPGVEPLRNLKSFTITGWLLVADGREGAATRDSGAGNRILSWLAPGKTSDGVELVWRADGSLQLGINQPAEASRVRTPANRVPVVDAKAKDPGQAALNAWRFFAATYDAGAASGHAKLYLGEWQKDAELVASIDCARGASGPKIAPALTVGNVPAMIRPLAPDRSFRGTIDEVRLFGSPADGSGALPLPEILKLQNRPQT